MTKKKSNIGKKSRNTQQKAASLKRKPARKFMDLTPTEEKSQQKKQKKDTQELLETPSQDSMKVDDGLAQKMLAALDDSEGNIINAILTYSTELYIIESYFQMMTWTTVFIQMQWCLLIIPLWQIFTNLFRGIPGHPNARFEWTSTKTPCSPTLRMIYPEPTTNPVLPINLRVLCQVQTSKVSPLKVTSPENL